MNFLSKYFVLSVGAILFLLPSLPKAEEVNDIVYFKLFGKIIGVENIYYYSLDKDGALNAYVRPEFQKDEEYHYFFFGKVEQSALDSWEKLVKSESGRKYSKCGMSVIDIKWTDGNYYRVIHDGNDYLTVGSSTTEMPDYFVEFMCKFDDKIKG